MKILLVDDHHDTMFILTKLIHALGHDVQMAADGFQALEIAGAWQPQCVLLDIALPKMDGYVLARRLRSECGLPSARIVALSGYPKNDLRFAESGMDDYLIKPVNLADLMCVLGVPPP
jgi:CheY-like chemotaxis protein